MKDKVLIYEVHYSNFNRYVIPLAQHLIESKISKEVVLIYDSFVKSQKIDEVKNHNVSRGLASEVWKSLQGNDNRNIVFLNYSYRIPDLYWTSKFKKEGVCCYQMQHGMYAEFLERSFLGYFSAIGRKWIYLKYLFAFSLKGKWVVFLYLINKDFIKSFSLNTYIESKKVKIESVQSNQIFIWGDYWKKWFVKNHFYKESDNFTTVGNPDYHTFIKGKKIKREPEKVCYIAQTFVEDGRMEMSDYKTIMNRLSNALTERLIVKLHPRSNKAIFEKVVENRGKLTYDFPITGHYIGHYSSLLALAANNDSKVFLLEINNEEIPHYFKNSADGIYSKVENLILAINSNEDVNGVKEIAYYFENKEEHPYTIIGQRILLNN
ncbi:hypothetical protein [uncultured Croceitalea sp.]|uniref:polysialyltransferase family glycosyltransferase n=1 Tax=uncultured Croceitalea sp. TaxID=1798908 RepID=UPI00330587B9